MPVSVVRDTAASAVNAALRESLASSGSCSAAAKAKHTSTQDDKINGGPANNADDIDTFHAKLVASAKRVSFSKLDYKEVANYGQSVLETLKSKYIILNPPGNTMENDLNSVAPNNNGANDESEVDDTGNNTSKSNCVDQSIKKVNNTIELPAPKRILYPRENVRIGWKATGRKWEIGVGMMNVGNTCYLNSTLQALFHVPSMANWLMSDSTHMERCETTGVGCIICAMTKTLQESQKSQSAIEPHYVYSKLNPMCKNLVMGRQEDAHEFLRYLMEAMEKSYLSRFRNYKELDQYSKETTPLNQILGGYLKSAVRCLACSHVSVTFQHFQDLLLDIRKADTVDEALEGYFSRERLEDMGYRCDACKKNVSATKQFSLERAPIALCIQLKRFSMSGTKLNKQIQIKPRLDLTKFASRKIPGEQLTYRLVAMITHLGTSQHSGHYTAIGLTESGTYYNYDDSYVRPISMQNVCNTNAYIIFYEMDTQPSKIVNSILINSTQTNSVSSDTNQKESQTLKINGQTVQNSHRIIGPQLPPGYKNNTNSNEGSSSPLSNGGNKLILNRNSALTPSSSSNSTASPNGGCSKIMIHFKNNSNTLPSMPKLGVEASTSTSTLTSGLAKKSPPPVKSLVPYGSETDDETDVGMATTALNAIAGSEQKKHLIPNMLKRRWSTPSSLSSSSSDNDDGNDNAMKPSNNKKIKKAAFSTTSVNSATILKPPDSAGKKSLDIIDDIFNNNNKRTNIANVNNKTSGSNTLDKKKSQNQQFIVTSTATDSSSESEDDNNKTNSPNTSPPSKKSQPAPPFPPVVKTNSGVWQVTSLQPNTSCTSPTTSFPSSSSVATTPKNPKNPFATKPLLATDNAKRIKKDTSNKTINGNGYRSNAFPNESTVSELLKQSHRGYGAPILNWNGQQSDIDKEIIREVHEQRQRDWEDEEENEMDRGRQKKIKAPKDPYAITSDYNPFQELENQKRWRRYHYVGDGGVCYRNNFQRSKFKSQRFTQIFPKKKYERWRYSKCE